MRFFYCDDHDHAGLGGYSVVAANTIAEARHLLDAELVKKGLRPHKEYPYVLIELDPPQAVVLWTGDY